MPTNVPTLFKTSSSYISPMGFSTFIVEALLLFVCLILVVTLSISAFAFASTKGNAAALEQKAIVLATNTAERFTADPLSVPQTDQYETMIVDCSIDAIVDEVGTMYTASIVVYETEGSADEPLYALTVSKYASRLSDAWGKVR